MDRSTKLSFTLELGLSRINWLIEFLYKFIKFET